MALEDSYAECKRLTRLHGTTYYWSTAVLPAVKRHHVHALYAFCRRADDVVDDPGPASVAARGDALRDLGTRFFDDLAAGRSDDLVLKAVVHTVRAFDIDVDAFRRFLRSMEMDLSVECYASYDDLRDYMDGSAAVIGEMMLPILEPRTVDAVAPARADRARGRALEPDEHARDGRLARSRLAHDPQRAAGRDAERHIVDRHEGAERLAQPDRLQHRLSLDPRIIRGCTGVVGAARGDRPSILRVVPFGARPIASGGDPRRRGAARIAGSRLSRR